MKYYIQVRDHWSRGFLTQGDFVELFSLVLFGGLPQDLETDQDVLVQGGLICGNARFDLIEQFDEGTSDAAGPVRPVRIDRDALQTRQQQTDQFITRFLRFHEKEGAPGAARTRNLQIRRLRVRPSIESK